MSRCCVLTLALAVACTSATRDTQLGDAGEAGLGASSDGAAETGDDEPSSTGGLFDVGAATTGDDPPPPQQECNVVEELDGVGACDDQAPPDSFAPVLQWSYDGNELGHQSCVTPVVANLTDDNGDGVIDLCDVPDIVVVGYNDGQPPYTEHFNSIGRIFVLDGATGSLHFVVPMDVSALVTPAIGDIDADGIPEIVAAVVDDPDDLEPGRLVAFEHDGQLAWIGDLSFKVSQNAVALADLDADGDVEVVLDDLVADHQGRTIWHNPGVWSSLASVPVDLDGDGDMEVVRGMNAYHHDGSLYYDVADADADGGQPAIADIDGDGQPEVVVAGFYGLDGKHGLSVIEHDGTISRRDAIPELVESVPPAVHDIDGDGVPNLLLGIGEFYSVVNPDLTVLWSAAVADGSGAASGTAFDFLGDGSAEAMYADEVDLFVFGATGEVLIQQPRSSWTQYESPVVADVDNDGSAEIVVVSNLGYGYGFPVSPMVQVFRDEDDRWIQARRIWNQHAYHVTNVREDGTIPQIEPKHWLRLNTFRTQSQISADGSVCDPSAEG